MNGKKTHTHIELYILYTVLVIECITPPRKAKGTRFSPRRTRDGTAEPVSRDQIFKRERGQENINFPCSADQHELDWQPYKVDPYSATINDDNTYCCTHIHERNFDCNRLEREYI